jgi:hypothetical protein
MLALLHDRQRRRTGAMTKQAQRLSRNASVPLVNLLGFLLGWATARIARHVLRSSGKRDD